MQHLENFSRVSQAALGHMVGTVGKVKSCLIRGDHGIGKTQILENWGKANGYDVIILLAAQMESIGDLLGLPKQMQREIEDKKFEITSFCMPAKWHGSNKKLVIMDEINRAPAEITNSLFSLALQQEIPMAEYKLPPDSIVVATMNPDTEYYQVETMDMALLDRFARFDLVVNPDEWLTWASKQEGINTILLDYLSKNKARLKQIGCRSWTHLGQLPHDAAALPQIAISIVGNECASEWCEYARLNSDGWEEVLKDVSNRNVHEVCRAMDRSVQILSGLERQEKVQELLEKLEKALITLMGKNRMEELRYFAILSRGDAAVYMQKSKLIQDAIDFTYLN